MTDRELEEFITHGETGFVPMAMVFGEGWAKQAIEIAKELRARLAQPEPDELALIEQAMIEAWKPISQREWQPLTDEEMQQLNDSLNLMGRFPVIKAIEAKLKEKNG